MIVLIWSLSALAVVGTAIAIRHIKDARKKANPNPGGGYTPGPIRPAGWTPKANQYKIYWQDELDAKINQHVKEIAERGKLTEIDEKTMKQAILDVVHREMIRLSNAR